MKPSIGRIVHFVGNGMLAESSHYLAIITHVFTDICVNLFIFPKGMLLDDFNSGVRTSVVFGEEINNWHWPEKV